VGIFTGDGRVGRLQYFAINLALGIGWVVAVLLLTPRPGGDGDPTGLAVLIVLFPVMVWLSVTNMVRRLHDRDLSGRLAWWSLVPLVGFGLGLYLLFAPGDELANRYGPPPGPVDPRILEAKRAELEELQARTEALHRQADESYLRDDGSFDSDWLTSSVPGLGPSPASSPGPVDGGGR